MKTITTTIEIDASPEAVWQVLTDFPSHERWNPFFSRIIGSPEAGERLRITIRKGDGDGISIRPEVLVATPGRELRWKGKLLLPGIFDGEHCFVLEPLDGGRTRLIHGEKFRGILVPLTGRVLADTERGFIAFNEALADEVAARQVCDVTR